MKNRLSNYLTGCTFLLGAYVLSSGTLAAQESFRVELGQDGETIGDMRPVFLEFESRPMPAISPDEVARRYQRLFEQSDEPEVRIDALNRLSNIQKMSGQDIQFSDDKEQRYYEEALGSYESILQRGSFHGRLDELLYQMAKAHAYTGQGEASVSRLKQLVGLYPDSPLVPEARFRIAEAEFSAGNYGEAEAEYQRLINGGGGRELKVKARYMQGWSQYKQGRAAWQRAGSTFLEVLDEQSVKTHGFTRITSGNAELIGDTFRILAVMAGQARGVSTLVEWLEGSGDKAYVHLLYDRLADYYASHGRYEESVDTNLAFIHRHRGDSHAPEFLAQVVDVWTLAGRPDQVREARAEYVAAYTGDTDYNSLSPKQQERWKRFSRLLADYHYDRGQSLTGAASRQSFERSAGYYEGLARRTEPMGEVLRLAGDAWLQAERYDNALRGFRRAAYGTSDYAGAADAAWAAVVLLKDGLDNRHNYAVTLEDYATEAQRLAEHFSNDGRLPGLHADIANRMLASRNYARAEAFADAAIDHPKVSNAEKYSAWLVIGEALSSPGYHAMSENAWRNALELADSVDLPGVGSQEREAIRHQVAASIYRQAEAAADGNSIDTAVAHFHRVETVVPGSDIATTARYDAANTLLKASLWQRAITELTRFRTDYPNHELTGRISEKLVLAYTSSGQPVRAADELMEYGQSRANVREVQHQAAELYHRGDAFEQRNRLYAELLESADDPVSAGEHLSNQRMRQRLIESGMNADSYRQRLVSAELASKWHAEETLSWAAQAALLLGEKAARRFADIALVQPLARSLERKQEALEEARGHFVNAGRLGGEAVQSEVLYRRAELYRGLARSLMASSPPDNLNELETAQYRMLIEEEAYPFEEKAIRLHAENHQSLATSSYNRWVEKSLQALAELFPGRYAREVQWMTWNPEAADGA